VRGPVNVGAPHPVRNAEFAETLGRVLGRPAAIPVPAFALRLAFGDMAEAMLLSGQRMSSARLEASGYRFRYPTLEQALRFELSRG
jgi:NAD dependent epimerase/dehydratase family enzyme